MNILNLIVYNPHHEYEILMHNEIQKYISLPYIQSFVTSFFIVFRNNPSGQVIEMENNIIYIQGEESQIKLICKTMLALEFCIHTLQIDFDYFYRTNISTITDFFRMRYYLEQNKSFQYGGFYNLYFYINVEKAKQYLPYVDADIYFVQGHNILMNKDVIYNIINYDCAQLVKITNLGFNDDLALALLLLEKNIKPELLYQDQHVINYSVDDLGKYTVYRNKSNDRYQDAYKMHCLVEYLVQFYQRLFV